jgi:energy-coupling factor transport system permease protein
LFEGYVERDTWIDRLDPRTKVAWLIVVIALAATAPTSRDLALLGGAVVLAGVAGGRGARQAFETTLAFLPVLLAVCLQRGLVDQPGAVLLEVGPFGLHEAGLAAGLRSVARLWTIALAGLQFVGWSRPSDVTLILVGTGLPYRYAMLFGFALRFLPVLERELAAIFDAQESRGLDLRGPVRRAVAFLPIFLPFCLRALRRADEVALALELRGFGYAPTRTFGRALSIGRVDLVFAIGSGLAAAALVAVR